MFNFSANHVVLQSSVKYDKCTVYLVKDLDTKRCYKLYDYSLSFIIEAGKVYCVSGKVNSAGQLYLILEHCKEDKKYYQQYEIVKDQLALGG